MIQSLQLSNFQSHASTTLAIHPGINAIVGQSDCGKTSLLRALRWLRDNRPSGDEFMSHWCWNGDKLIGRGEVTLVLDDGSTVTRARDAKFNGYLVGDQKLAAVRMDVPVQVSEILNMSEVNDQGQLDPPFLLTDSPAEVARFFNRVLKLEEVDQVLSMAETRRRKAVAAVTDTQDKLAENTRKLGNMDWVDDALASFDGIQKDHQDAQDAQVEYSQQEVSLDRYQGYALQLTALSWLPGTSILVEDLRASLAQRTTAQEILQELEEGLDRWFQLQEDASRLDWLGEELPQKVPQLRAWVERVQGIEVSRTTQSKAMGEEAARITALARLQYLDQEALAGTDSLRADLQEVARNQEQASAQTACLENWRDRDQKLATLAWLGSEPLQDLGKLGTLVGRLVTVETEHQDKLRSYTAWRSQGDTIQGWEDEVQELTAQLPAACPLCQKPYHEGHH